MNFKDICMMYWPRLFFKSREDMVIVLIVITIVCLVMSRVFKWKKRQYVLSWILSYYLIMVFISTVFARKPQEFYEYELELFWSYRRGVEINGRFMICEIILNIFMLFPVGLFLPGIINYKFKKKSSCGGVTVAIGFCVSVAIEVLQLDF